jgi:beta-N-acetylhexosaminidase
LGDYLPWTKGTNKQDLKIWDILLHQAGLKDFIPFYKETIDTTKSDLVSGRFYSNKPDSMHLVRVADHMYMRNDWTDTIYNAILKSAVGPRGKYVYSDNDFIFLGKIVEALSGLTLDQYVKTNFYDKLGLTGTGFKPRDRFPLNDLAVLCQMILNGGTFNGQQFIKKTTLDYFSQYHSENSRRGLGFDKPEKDNAVRKDPYPALSASPQTIGHTGYTGTCFWIDPKYNLVFVFLSNRVNPDGGSNTKISTMSIRPKIMEAIYKAMDK